MYAAFTAVANVGVDARHSQRGLIAVSNHSFVNGHLASHGRVSLPKCRQKVGAACGMLPGVWGSLTALYLESKDAAKGGFSNMAQKTE